MSYFVVKPPFCILSAISSQTRLVFLQKLDKNVTLRLSCEPTVKATRGVRAGLSLTCFLINVDEDVDIAKLTFHNYLKYLSDHRPPQKLSSGSLESRFKPFWTEIPCSQAGQILFND